MSWQPRQDTHSEGPAGRLGTEDKDEWFWLFSVKKKKLHGNQGLVCFESAAPVGAFAFAGLFS